MNYGARYRKARTQLEKVQNRKDEAGEVLNRIEAEEALKTLHKKIDEGRGPFSAFVDPPRNLCHSLDRKIAAMKKKLKELEAENAELRIQLEARE